jgi:predicted enzyme related to lactoylglutathione lyase
MDAILPPTYEIPLGRLRSVAPGLPTRDMARTVDAYERLGFRFGVPGGADPSGAGFAIAERDGVALQFALKHDHDPSTRATWIYVAVDDCDELARELEAAGVELRRPPHDTDYGMRELAWIDPDGNLVLFGSGLPRDGVPAVATAKPADRGH